MNAADAPNPLDEAFVDWLAHVVPNAHTMSAAQRDVMELSFYAGAAFGGQVACRHGHGAVIAAIQGHADRMLIATRPRADTEHDAWRKRFHAMIDRKAMEAQVYIVWKARQYRRELGLPERP